MRPELVSLIVERLIALLLALLLVLLLTLRRPVLHGVFLLVLFLALLRLVLHGVFVDLEHRLAATACDLDEPPVEPARLGRKRDAREIKLVRGRLDLVPQRVAFNALISI